MPIVPRKQNEKEAFRFIACHRAARVAISYLHQLQKYDNQNSKTSSLFSKERQAREYKLTELKKCVIESEFGLRRLVLDDKLTTSEQIRIVFDLLDADRTNFVKTKNLARCFVMISPGISLVDATRTSQFSIMAFQDTSERGENLNLEEFQEFLTSLAAQTGDTLEDSARFWLLKVATASTGAVIMHDLIEHCKTTLTRISGLLSSSLSSRSLLSQNDTKTTKEFVQARFLLTFQMFDLNRNDRVLYSHVVKSLYGIAHHIQRRFQKLLLVHSDGDDDEERIDIAQFIKLLAAVVAACSSESIGIHEVFDAITIFQCCNQETKAQEESYNDLFMENSLSKIAIQDSVSSSSNPSCNKLPLSQVDLIRVEQLFLLLDLDGDGTIDASELFLGLRKFHCDQKQMDQTLEEVSRAIKHYDIDGNPNGSLDFFEFAMMLHEFAQATKVTNMVSLIDFMVVHIVLEGNADAEREYLVNHT